MRIVGSSMLAALKRLSTNQPPTLVSNIRYLSSFGTMSLPERQPFSPDFFFRQVRNRMDYVEIF